MRDSRSRPCRPTTRRAARRSAIALLFILAAACGGGGDSTGSNSNNNNNNGPTTPTGGNTGPVVSPRQLYSFTPGAIGFYYGSPTLVGNAIYAGTSRGVLYTGGTSNAFYKLSLTLTKIWEYSLGSKEVRGSATLDSNGNIYFVVEEGRLPGNTANSIVSLTSLDNNGALRWTKQIMTHPPLVGMINPAVAADNTIYVGGDKLYAFDAAGNVKWTYGPSMIVMNAPIIDPAGNIYFSTGGQIISLASTGAWRWTVIVTGEYYSSPAFSVTRHPRLATTARSTSGRKAGSRGGIIASMRLTWRLGSRSGARS